MSKTKVEIKQFMDSGEIEPELVELDLVKKTDAYSNNIEKDGNWATDYELALTLDINIFFYVLENNISKFGGVYFGSNDYLNMIPLQFIKLSNYPFYYRLYSFFLKDIKDKKL